MAPTDVAPRTTEHVPEQSANARNEQHQLAELMPVERTPVERLPVKIGYVLAALALIGLCVGAVVAVLGDEKHVSTGGTIAAISAGLLGATVMVGLVVVFHRKRNKPAEATEPKGASAHSSNGKSRSSRPAPAKRPVPRTAARS